MNKVVILSEAKDLCTLPIPQMHRSFAALRMTENTVADDPPLRELESAAAAAAESASGEATAGGPASSESRSAGTGSRGGCEHLVHV